MLTTRRSSRWVALATAVALLATTPAAADLAASAEDSEPPGTLDPTFDDDGTVLTALTSSVATEDSDLQVLEDGTERIIVLAQNNTLWALTPDGGVDTSFGSGGVVRISTFASVNASRVAVAHDGAIVVAGWNFAFSEVRVARFVPDGDLDESFGSFGTARVSNNGNPDDLVAFTGIADIGVQSDGFVVVAGTGTRSAGSATDTALVLARLTAVGAVERMTSTGLVPTLRPRSVAIYRDDEHVDRVAVSAAAFLQGANVIAYRYLPDLDPDPSFGGSGFNLTLVSDNSGRLPVVAGDDGSLAIAVESPRQPVVNGGGSIPPAWRVLRWPPDGSNHTVAVASFPDADNVTFIGGIAATAAGGYVVAGEIPMFSGPYALGLAHYPPGGQPVATMHAHAGDDWTDVSGRGVVRLADGSLRVAGTAETLVDASSEEMDRRILLSRVTPAGSFDDAFGPDGDGFALVSGGGSDRGTSVVVQPDRKVVVGGVGGPREGFVLRYLEDGSLDPDFGDRGVTYLDFEVLDVALDPADGAIAAVGDDRFWGGAVQRLTADGSPDPDFNDGVQQVHQGFTTALRGVVVQDDQRIVVVGDIAGSTSGGGGSSVEGHIVVARFLPDGVADDGFGPGEEGDFPGISRIGVTWEESARWARGNDVALDGAGRLLVTGHLDFQLALARLDPDGLPDETFGPGHPAWGPGIVQDDIAGFLSQAEGGDTEGFAVITDPATGDVLVAGDLEGFGGFGDPDAEYYDYIQTAFVARYDPAGRRHTGFGIDHDGDRTPDGVAFPVPLRHLPTPDDLLLSRARGIAVDAFGSIVVGGSAFTTDFGEVGSFAAFEVGEPVDDVFVARLLASGDQDATFGTDGLALTDLGATENGEDLAIAPDGKIVVGGFQEGPRAQLVLAARYLTGSGRLVCEPQALSFGVVRLGRSATTELTCRAEGGAVTVTGIVLTPDSSHPLDFVVFDEFCTGTNGTLAADATCTIPVRFAPTDDGVRSASLLVTSGSADGPVSVRLTGTGVEVRPVVLQPIFTATPDPLVFGEHLVGTTSDPRRVTVRNTGTSPLQITEVTVTGPQADDFRITATTCAAASVAPRTSCTVDVEFTPGSADPDRRLGLIRFDDNAPGGPHLVRLQGDAVEARLTIDPDEGPIGTEFTAEGEGYRPGIAVDLDILGDAIGTVPAGEVGDDGTFTVTLTVPDGVPGGPQPVTACQRCGQLDARSASAEFTVTPRLFVSPEVSRAGRVVLATGDGFPANTPVTLRWQPGLGITRGAADDTGRLRTQVLIFNRDIVGQRELQASISGASEVVATTEALIVPGTIQPGEFAVRR